MPVESSWLVQDRVLLTRLIGSVTVEELAEISRVGTRMIESGISPVYGLVDLTKMTHYPMRIADFRSFYQQTSDNLAIIIFYGIPNPIVNALVGFVTKLTRTHYKVVDDQAQALALVNALEEESLSDPVAEIISPNLLHLP